MSNMGYYTFCFKGVASKFQEKSLILNWIWSHFELHVVFVVFVHVFWAVTTFLSPFLAFSLALRKYTVPIRRKLTGNVFANGYRTDTEQVWECERKRYRMDTEQIPNGYRTGTGMRAERWHNTFWQAFPIRFFLIGTVKLDEFVVIVFFFYCNSLFCRRNSWVWSVL